MSITTYSLVKDGEKFLSPHFKVKEFKSYNDSTKQLTTDIIKNDNVLIEKLERLYDYLKCSKIIITSGYRSEDFETLLGGNSRTSQHCKGKAGDIICYKNNSTPFTVDEMLKGAEKVGFTGIGKMRNTIHVDVRPAKSYFDETTGKTGISTWCEKTVEQNFKYYTVKKGDSYWRIATYELKNGRRYPEILKLNGFTESTVIHPTQVIKIPKL